VELVFELRNSCLLGECSTTWVIPPVLITLIIFHIASWSFCQGPSPKCDPPISTSQAAGTTGVNYHTQRYFLRCRVLLYCSELPQTSELKGAFYLHILCNKEKQQVCATGPTSPINMFNLWRNLNIQSWSLGIPEMCRDFKWGVYRKYDIKVETCVNTHI
jgi:hypothetical protein